MTHDELIAALESATGPSRELDAGIAKSVGWKNIRANWWPPEEVAKARKKKASLWSCDRGPLPLPDYTASIDAALTLVPEGLRWRVSCVPVHQFAGASVLDGSILSPNTKEWEGKHATHAIALCIAALKAREKE